MQLLLVAIAGGIGTSMRYGLGLWLSRIGGWHWHTFTANTLGSFLIVLAAFWLQEHRAFGADTRTVLMTGAMGGFTTYSAFNLEVLLHFQKGEWGRGLAYLSATVLSCLLAGVLGLWTIRVFR